MKNNNLASPAIRCMIIDDEHLAQILLEDYITQIPDLQLVAKCSSALEALSILKQESVDLLFLDINMPQLTGIEFLKTLRDNKPNVIFTTAYADYAVESYDFDAIDYLLKPITLERFVQAVEKASEFIAMKKGLATNNDKNSSLANKDYMFVKSGYKMVKVRFDEILYIEGLREYVHIHTQKQSIVTLESLKRMDDLLPTTNFIRTHKSYIVSIDKVDAYTSTNVEVNQQSIPIGRSYRSRVAEIYGKK